MSSIILADNISQGALVALKMAGGVAAAAVLLYLVLLLTRVLGTKLEDKKYDKYCQNYRDTHGNEDGMLSKEAFVEERAKGNAVVWRRSGKTANMYDIPQPAAPQANHSTDLSAQSCGDEDACDPSESKESTTTLKENAACALNKKLGHKEDNVEDSRDENH